ncbi:hypothetical protein EVAR_43240_1 [Eumeta japonica]|uniref:Uncharacterized protein n=1 Tax=Eumeta variegata TaxID=151549 RepID=A0A4C1WVX4_EUMVA|nr:hypothetical protein EVAR_43240_1 [Eumeta japonica]
MPAVPGVIHQSALAVRRARVALRQLTRSAQAPSPRRGSGASHQSCRRSNRQTIASTGSSSAHYGFRFSCVGAGFQRLARRCRLPLTRVRDRYGLRLRPSKRYLRRAVDFYGCHQKSLSSGNQARRTSGDLKDVKWARENLMDERKSICQTIELQMRRGGCSGRACAGGAGGAGGLRFASERRQRPAPRSTPVRGPPPSL